MSRKRSKSRPDGNSRGQFINPTDFKVGDMLMSNKWGEFEVVDYPNARFITVRFPKTGNLVVRQKGEILRGVVTDRHVINKMTEQRNSHMAFKKDSFDVFMSSWNPVTHNKNVFKLPYFFYCKDKGWVYKGFTYVDEYTYNFVSKIKWIKSIYIQSSLSKDNCRRLGVNKPKGRKQAINLHSWVKAMPTGVKDLVTDHKNGSKLDNRPDNLRIANYKQNAGNSKCYAISGYRGVKFKTDKSRTKPWAASQCESIGGKQFDYSLGYYYTKEDAAKAVDLFNIHRYGEFARLNLGRKIYEDMGLLEPKPKKYKLP